MFTDRTRAAYCLYTMIVLCLAAGCGNKQEAVETVPPVVGAASPAAAPGIGDEAARKFLAALEAKPFSERMGYVNAHQADAAMVGQSKNPDITRKLTALMTPPVMTPPQSPSTTTP